MIHYHQPFLLPPNRVWRTYSGGKILDEIEGNANPKDSHFPEDWVGSATRAVNPGREDQIDEGIGVVQTVQGDTFSMTDFFAESPIDVLGQAHLDTYGAESKLLVKLLDSAMRLHIQAHPSVSWAQTHLNANSGKTEAWWILQTRTEDAWVYIGFQQPPNQETWRRIVDEQDLAAMEACFDRIPVAPGDVLLIEGGVPHAIGPGIMMVEIQEPTDYVVRCEYAHGGLSLPESARTMGLGLDRVLDMFDYTAYPAETVKSHFGPKPRTLSHNEKRNTDRRTEKTTTSRIAVLHFSGQALFRSAG
ncbi:MAG: class I mannose-6-phosphate isomerase [Chloroflexota bacterium]